MCCACVCSLELKRLGEAGKTSVCTVCRLEQSALAMMLRAEHCIGFVERSGGVAGIGAIINFQVIDKAAGDAVLIIQIAFGDANEIIIQGLPAF